MKLLILTLLLTTAASHPIELQGPAGSQTLDAKVFLALPRVEVEILDHGTKARFEGAELRHIMDSVGLPHGQRLRGRELAGSVIVTARDGYRVLFAVAELDPAFNPRRIILADRRDGKPLSESEGPWRIIVEGEKRMGRCVRQVSKLSYHR